MDPRRNAGTHSIALVELTIMNRKVPMNYITVTMIMALLSALRWQTPTPRTQARISQSPVAFPVFANGGCSCATHVNMRMRGNTYAHLDERNDGFRSFTRSNHARFAALLPYPSPSASAPGAGGRKHCGFCVAVLTRRVR